MTVNKKKITCPTCGKTGTWISKNPFRPFCSERCKLIDLGEWASEKYRILGPAAPTPEEGENEEEEDK